MNNNFYNLYFKNTFKNFCLICGKNCNNISCEKCNNLIYNLEGNNLHKINFLKNPYYWMDGENKFGEKIKSYGSYYIQRIIPINTIDILKYINKINLIKENKNNFVIQIETTNNTKFNIIIPKIKLFYQHFISYENLFLYPELNKKLSLCISN